MALGVEGRYFRVLQGQIYLYALESFPAVFIRRIPVFAYADFCTVGSTDECDVK